MKKIKCPICGQVMHETLNSKKPASCYEDCIRKCLNCEVGASNNDKKQTFIYKDFFKNIPNIFHKNLKFTLDNVSSKI